MSDEIREHKITITLTDGDFIESYECTKDAMPIGDE